MASNDLLFENPKQAPGSFDLLFGETADGPVIPTDPIYLRTLVRCSSGVHASLSTSIMLSATIKAFSGIHADLTNKPAEMIYIDNFMSMIV